MSSKTVGLVICAYKGHIPHLKRLFASIEAQTRKPDMVVVSCSSTEPHDMPYSPDVYSFPLLIHTHSEKKNAAQNRNYGASLLTTDIISFIDADDIMHPQRIEIIYDSFTKYDIYVFLHSTELYSTIPFEEQPQTIAFSPIYTYEFVLNQLYRCPWGSAQLHVDKRGETITCGHISVLRSILTDISFRETADYHGKEDTIFATDIIQKYPNHTCYCYQRLSTYYPSRTYGYEDK